MTFLLPVLSIVANYLQQLHNKTAAGIGNDIAIADAVTLAVLQQNAQIKGLTIDWSDPAAVQNFLATLPSPTLIPDPAAPAPVVQAKDPKAS
jgi:hypothetical protein